MFPIYADKRTGFKEWGMNHAVRWINMLPFSWISEKFDIFCYEQTIMTDENNLKYWPHIIVKLATCILTKIFCFTHFLYSHFLIGFLVLSSSQGKWMNLCIIISSTYFTSYFPIIFIYSPKKYHIYINEFMLNLAIYFETEKSWKLIYYILRSFNYL